MRRIIIGASRLGTEMTNFLEICSLRQNDAPECDDDDGGG